MIRVYQYGTREPIHNSELVHEQLRKAHKYYCALLRMTIDVKRNKERELQNNPEVLATMAIVAELEAAVKSKRESLAKIRQSTRSRSESKELRASIKEDVAKLKEARMGLKTVRAESRTSARLQRDFLHEEWLQQRRALRKASGLRHGTYTMTESAVDAACSSTPLWDSTAINDPRFPKWDGTGHVGVQIQGGMTFKQLLSCTDTRAQFRYSPDLFLEKCKDGRGGGKSRPRFGTLHIRVGSDESRNPIWAEFPIKLHRPIPEDGVIKFIAVSKRRIGPREIWSTEFTVDLPEGTLTEKCGNGTVAVDLGWRLIDGELRVLTWYGEHSGNGELRLSAELISSLRYNEALRSVRDKNLDTLRAQLLAYLPEELPDWLLALTRKRGDDLPSSAQARARIAKWKSQARFAHLAKVWPGGCPEFLEEWRYHDFHLWEWEASQRKKSLRRRKDLYRNFAAKLTRRYSRIILEDFDLRRVAENKAPEEDAENKRSKSNRQLCATSELRLAIIHAAAARGCEIVWVNPAYSTQECPHDDCRHTEKWDAEHNIRRRPDCPKCGRSWDQDYAAAYVLLRRWKETPTEELPKKNQQKEPRRERMAKQRAEKLERMKNAGDEASAQL